MRPLTYGEIVRNVATGWKRSKCGLASEIVVVDLFPLPIAHEDRDARWCVQMTCAAMTYHATGAADGYMSLDAPAFLGEYDSREQANRAAGQFRRLMNATYDAA